MGVGVNLVETILATRRRGPAPAPTPPLLSPDLDCARCGACCVEAGEVPVRPGERVPPALTAEVEGVGAFRDEAAGSGLRRMARSPGRRCAALEGQVGTSCSCAIYADRPAACRAFPVGSEGCRAAREVAERRLSSGLRSWGYGDVAEVARQRAEWGR